MGKLSGVELGNGPASCPVRSSPAPRRGLRSLELSRAQKLAILRRWEFDAPTTPAEPAARQDGQILEQAREALRVLGAARPGAVRGSTTRH